MPFAPTSPPVWTPATPLLFLGGPTATGKSEIALLLAERLNGEIVSVDSMQVYRGLDIGTAKPTPAERARVPHHLGDLLELGEGFDAACFILRSRAAIEQIQARGRLPILCGGTGFYFKALLEGLGQAPPADPRLRTKLGQTPLVELLAELAEADPATFSTIDRQNSRRVIRAVEVIRLTGRPFSELRTVWKVQRPQATGHSQQSAVDSPQSTVQSPQPTNHGGQVFFGVDRPAGELNRRIEQRVDLMFKNGLIAETEQLLKHGLAENPTAAQALGYRQVIEFLRGQRSLSDTVELVKIRTRQFAKRQRTWFRNQLYLDWIQLGADAPPAFAAAQIERAFLTRAGSDATRA